MLRDHATSFKSPATMVGRVGFLSAFERFGPEFEDTYEIDRKKEFTGDASLVYSWSVDD